MAPLFVRLAAVVRVVDIEYQRHRGVVSLAQPTLHPITSHTVYLQATHLSRTTTSPSRSVGMCFGGRAPARLEETALAMVE